MPPASLRVGVAGASDREWFSVSGRRDAELFKDFAARHGAPLAEQSVVVDLGCGCGRIARWMAPEVTGTGHRFLGFDVDARMAAWCGANLVGEYRQNRLLPPLACADGAADLLYAYSVFTHLRERTVVRWLEEIGRVLRPGGLALVTFHDETYAEVRGFPDVQAALATSDYFVLNDALEGSNYISAWTSRAHFTRLAARAFDVVAIEPGKADLTQALAVLRKR